MNFKIIIPVIMSACVLLLPLNLQGSTSISATGDYITTDGLDEIAAQYQTLLDNFGPAVSNAYALANVSGYPMGVSSLGGLGHFCLGLSLNAGMTNMSYFDTEAETSDEVLPAIAVNPVITFGIGMGKRVDVLAKAFLFSSGFYMPPMSYSFLKLEKVNIYSFGGKIRYNLVEKKTLMPGVFNFGGVNVSAGGDFMYGLLSFTGQYDYPLTSIEVDPDGGAGPLSPAIYDLTFMPDYLAEVNWFVITANVQALTYFNFYWIFDFYTGFGLAVNFATFNVDLNAVGDVSADDPAFPGPDPVSQVTAVSSNSYRPYYFLPLYIIGIEVNLFVVRLTLESMVSLRNGSDINMQFGVRTQF